MPKVAELQKRIHDILEEERELNSDHPLIESLLTRIENRINECVKEIRKEQEKD
jgi:predicted  nucleic acid-binding Zn-ribbon protein